MALFDRIDGTPSVHILVFVAAADTLVWLAGVPFELYCKTLLASHQVERGLLALILLANASLLATMAFAMSASAVLASRGLRQKRQVQQEKR